MAERKTYCTNPSTVVLAESGSDVEQSGLRSV